MVNHLSCYLRLKIKENVNPILGNIEGGAVAEWSKALQLRENKRKSKRSQFRPPAWATFKKHLEVLKGARAKPSFVGNHPALSQLSSNELTPKDNN